MALVCLGWFWALRRGENPSRQISSKHELPRRGLLGNWIARFCIVILIRTTILRLLTTSALMQTTICSGPGKPSTATRAM